MTRGSRRILWAGAAVAVGGLLTLSLMPSPVPVDAGRVQRGPMQVTVDQEGRTQAHDRFVIAAPAAGRLGRVELHNGDPVAVNQEVAVIHAVPLEPRERMQALARVQAAEALRREAEERSLRARADLEQARRELRRAEQLGKEEVISTQALEQARNAAITAANEFEAARHRVDAAANDVKAAQAALLALDEAGGGGDRTLRLRSPVRGRVLRILEKSERVVTPGTPLVVLGDPARIEIVIDVLSTDAVKVQPGAPVILRNWGGEGEIHARVRVVEPYAFTKISSLGIEEQRVNIIADFVDLPGPLGDGYRVEAQIVIWAAEKILKAPASALFRRGEKWAVFVVEDGKARLRDIETGHRNPVEVEVIGSLREGEGVVLYPPNDVRDGVRVSIRKNP